MLLLMVGTGVATTASTGRSDGGEALADPIVTTVMAVDDHPLYCFALEHLISAEPTLRWIGDVRTGRDARAHIRGRRPGITLLDLGSLPHQSFELLRDLSAESASRFIVLSSLTDGHLVQEAIAAGASGFLSKRAAPEQIRAAILAAARGELVLPRDLQAALASHMRAGTAAVAPLTAKEREILMLLADGSTQADVAQTLYVCRTTVKSHLRNIYEKLDVSTQTAAVVKAMRLKLIDD